jgi:DNA-binding CsgD family transcriptional regulator
MDQHLNQITGLTDRERKRLFSWIASLPEETIVEIFQAGVKAFYQLRQGHPELPGRIGKYAAFILAARRAGWDTLNGKGYRVAEQPQYDDFSHLRKARAAELLRRGRTPVVRRKILAYWGEVKELKAEGHGFRSIADFLHKSRKVKTSASYLLKLWHEVEGEGGI